MTTTSSWYRRTIWNLKGNKEYTKSGYESARLRFDEKDLDVDCSQRHYIITGANSGIGLETAVEIAKRGGILHLICRNAKSMKEARSHIITTTGNDKIYQHQVNLAKPREVSKWAEEFLVSGNEIDVLIHNAGALILQREVDEEGIEASFSTNVLSIHLITTTLLPLLKKSEDPRVIVVSSAGMLKVKLNSNDLNFEKMNPYDGRLAYSQTKRQEVVMTFCYAQRYEGIKFFSMHPGWADTPSVRNSLPAFYEQMKDNLRTPLQGADTVIWLAISKAALKHSSGLFFQDRMPVPTHLPLAWTRTSTAEEQEFMHKMDELYKMFSSVNVTENLPPSNTKTEEDVEPREFSEEMEAGSNVNEEQKNIDAVEGEEPRVTQSEKIAQSDEEREENDLQTSNKRSSQETSKLTDPSSIPVKANSGLNEEDETRTSSVTQPVNISVDVGMKVKTELASKSLENDSLVDKEAKNESCSKSLGFHHDYDFKLEKEIIEEANHSKSLSKEEPDSVTEQPEAQSDINTESKPILESESKLGSEVLEESKANMDAPESESQVERDSKSKLEQISTSETNTSSRDVSRCEEEHTEKQNEERVYLEEVSKEKGNKFSESIEETAKQIQDVNVD